VSSDRAKDDMELVCVGARSSQDRCVVTSCEVILGDSRFIDDLVMHGDAPIESRLCGSGRAIG
jgi:hypothetical protein